MTAEPILDCARSPLERGITLVEASAGTGKTYAIGMLVLRAVAELGIPIERILVVTFTKAATEELRSRIRRRLAEARDLLATGSGGDATLCDWAATVSDLETVQTRLRQALGTIDRAAIFTIHSFCLQMLGEQALESGQLFDAELTGDVERVRNQVVEDFWRHRLYALAPVVCGMVLDKYPTPAALASSVVFPGMGDAALVPESEPFSVVAERLRSSYEDLADWYRREGDDLFAAFAAAGAEGKLKKPLDTGLETWWRELSAWIDGTGGQPENLSFLCREGVKAALNGRKVKKAAQDAFVVDWPLPDRQVTELLAAGDRLLVALRRELVVTLMKEVSGRLLRRGQMSFDDLIIQLDTALHNNGAELQKQLADRFGVALIDEFQDTDNRQWRIFDTLFGQGEHYLYLIGDPKQAIYRFRGADIYSYFAAKRRADHRGTLPRNYRSHPLLVAEVNRLFSRRAEPFGLPEEMLGFSPVTPARGEADGELSRGGRVQPVMNYCRLPSHPSGREWYSGQAAEAIRDWVVAEVATLLDPASSTMVVTTVDGEPREQPLTPRDIAVLVRTNHQADSYLQRFAEAGIAAIVASRQSVLTTEEAGELLLLLTALALPGDLYGGKRAMTISWFGHTGNSLLELWEDEAALDDWINRFLGYHQLWREKGFLAMMNRLLAGERVYHHLAGQPLAERRITNIHHLLELVQEAETSDKLGPEGTLAWLQSMVAGKTESGQEERELRLESDEEAVRIVTMHGCKGLQYPVVFCPLLWYRSDRERKAELVRCHSGEQLVVDLGSTEMETHRQQMMAESLGEELRLAYVALTRAELCSYTVWADVKPIRGTVNSSFSSALGHLLFGEKPIDAQEQDRLLQEWGEESGAAYRILELDLEPSAAGGRRGAPSHEAVLSCRQPGSRSLVTDYQLSSYSAMASLSEQEDHGSESVVADEAEETGEAEAANEPEEVKESILHPGLPAGTGFGNLVHDLLEQLPFAKLAAATPREEITRLCRRYGMSRAEELVVPLLASVVTTPLAAGDDGFCLAQLAEDVQVCEMPFYFRMDGLDTRRINGVLADEPAVIPLGPKTMRGYLTGFIDLVCEQRGRFYLLDYKTNYLGPHQEDYRREGLIAAMASHNYGLQYWIYSLVLHRYLGGVLPGYRYEEHFGGVYYLFVRGMRPDIPGSGVFATLPDFERLAALDRCVGGEG